MTERLTDADLDGIARFGTAIESDQQAMAAELLAYRQAARALVEELPVAAACTPSSCVCRELEALRALVRGGVMATDKESLTVVAAPDIDKLEQLEQLVGSLLLPWVVTNKGAIASNGQWVAHNDPERNNGDITTRKTADALQRVINALPALLATARRERRMREALELLQRANRDDGLTEVARRAGMSMVLDAALAEEGQDG